MLFVAKNVKECSKFLLSTGGGGTPIPSTGAVVISASVGNLGRNLPVDTTTIQQALNRVPAGQGGANPALVIDGLCGSKTINAIKVFQLKHFGWKGSDGLVEPLKQTIAKLNEVLSSQMPAKGTTVSQPSSDVVMPDPKSFVLAKDFIRAANANLIAASNYLEQEDTPPGPISVFSREDRMRLLNRHFKIDSLGLNVLKRNVFIIIQNVFFRMRQVFERPGGLWGVSAFEADYTADKNLAYTNFGGYFRGGQFRFDKKHEKTGKLMKIRTDTIYICSAFSNHIPELQALVHVHELAHFVGNPEFIDDHAYNFQPNKMSNLPANLRVLNAENYMNFAWQAKRGDVQPPI